MTEGKPLSREGLEYLCHHCGTWGNHKQRHCPVIRKEFFAEHPLKVVAGRDTDKP